MLKQTNVKIESFHAYGDQRIEVKLSNGQALTLMVNSDNGKLSILNDAPHLISERAEVIRTKGQYKGQAMPSYIVSVDHYGHPFED